MLLSLPQLPEWYNGLFYDIIVTDYILCRLPGLFSTVIRLKVTVLF